MIQFKHKIDEYIQKCDFDNKCLSRSDRGRNNINHMFWLL